MLLPTLVLAMLLSGCQTINYYSHAALGQLRVLAGREPVPRVLAELDRRREEDPQADLLYRRLRLSQEVLAFAEAELGLSAGDRYRTYVDLQRPAVVWNLFAAAPLSLDPHRWCYPVVGCAPYRGYFDRNYAERGARALEEQGLETYLGPVAAYSTLGWFADPLLSSFVTWPEPDLAALLFHELAHGQAWARGDVAFNEAFATFVGREGLAVWLREHGSGTVQEQRLAALAERRRLLNLLQRTRTALRQIYRSRFSDSAKLELKARVFAAVGECYVDQRDALGGGRFDALMSGLNNARLVSVATYEDMVPRFAELFESVDGSWPAFFERVRVLAALDTTERHAALRPSGYQQVAQRGDDQGTDEVECEALSGHFLNAEFAGGVHDHVGRGGNGQHEGA
jgi:predicted aminopeptidase